MAKLKILITGPESSGKSTLASALAESLNASLVEEQARAYLHNLSQPYTEKDLLAMARNQYSAEHMVLGDIIVCDTGLEVIKIWSEEKYGGCDGWIEKHLRSSEYDTVFLCSPDIPWVSDPLRENPDDRDRLFNLYKNLLESLGWSFSILNGSENERLEQALELIETQTRLET